MGTSGVPTPLPAMRVVFVTTEVAPWSKVGGLADVMGALPPALASRGHHVMTVSPRYRELAGVVPSGVTVPLDLPADDESEESPPPRSAALFLARAAGVDHVFVDHPLFLAGGDIYDAGPSAGVSTYQEAGPSPSPGLELRYSILSQAALAAPLLLWAGGEPGVAATGPKLVFVANDWPATLALLRLRLCVRGGWAPRAEAGPEVAALAAALRVALAAALGALCIHNLAYQGVLPPSAFASLGLPPAALPWLETNSEWRALGEDAVPAAGDAAPQSSAAEGAAGVDDPAPGWRPRTECEDASRCGFQASHRPREGQHRTHLDADGPEVGLEESGPPRPPAATATLERPAEDCAGATQAVAVAAAATAPCVEDGTAILASPGGAEPGTPLNLMRGGLLAADGLLTVSPGYAVEVATNAHLGCGLHDVLAQRGVAGVLNGLDTEVWDPVRDEYLPSSLRYGPASAVEGKAAAKASLQARLGLTLDPDVPLFSFVGRLTQQKGVDIMLAALPALMAVPQGPAPVAALGQSSIVGRVPGPPPKPRVQVVILGSGEAWMEAALKGLELSFPGQAAGLPLFSEELAHWLMAASDYVLIPSRFEPCGLVALCAMRYGALPIVAATGGLQDIVDSKVGFTVPRLGSEASAVDVRQDVLHLIEAMSLAADQHGSEAHAAMRTECMARNVSWVHPAAKWEAWLAAL